jgi:hypothetical protein
VFGVARNAATTSGKRKGRARIGLAADGDDPNIHACKVLGFGKWSGCLLSIADSLWRGVNIRVANRHQVLET